ncbi:Arabinogalactan protein 41 [Ranunculus cassubicifolius]
MNSSMRSVLVLFLFALLQLTHAQDEIAPSPAPTSSGNTVDQGIAYLLMLVALAITYIFH